MSIHIAHLLWIVPLAMAAGGGILAVILACIAINEEADDGY